MDTSVLERIAARVEVERGRLAAGGVPPAAAAAELELDEVAGSLLLARSPLGRIEIEALAKRGVVLGGRPLEAYVMAADYIEAARYVRALPLAGRRRAYLTLEEIAAVHARVARRSSERAGEFRTRSLRAFRDGMVPPPAWLIPRAVAAYVERLQFGPPPGTSPIVWVADAHARFERIQPFDGANGRVGRCLINLLLRRLGHPPFVLRPHDAARYLEALRAADSRDPRPLALVLARSLLRSLTRLTAALPDAGELRPLSEFATGRERAALYKAAQRGRLRAFRRAGSLLTTAEWIAEYRDAPNA
jgi:hypothetical protein